MRGVGGRARCRCLKLVVACGPVLAVFQAQLASSGLTPHGGRAASSKVPEQMHAPSTGPLDAAGRPGPLTPHDPSLPCPGEKYKHCAAFGVTPVTADWLVDSITAGLLQPEKEYHPGRRAAAQAPLAHQSQAGGRPRQGQSQEQCGAGEGRASQASRKRAGEGAPADLGPLNLESLLEMTESGAGHREKAGPPPKRCVLGGHGRSRLPRAGSGE